MTDNSAQITADPTSIDIHRIETLPRLSRAVVHNGVVYLAGLLADNPEGSVEEQTQNILTKMEGFLAKAGSDKTRVLSATVWLRDIQDAPLMNTVWEAWVPPGCAPARSCVQSLPGRPGYSVEIALTAATRS
jgi:enamine deaminase RidA (YjgF/YER057c/UK114 family)